MPLTFPQSTGRNLNGKAFTFPQDFPTQLNIVVLAFRYGQGALIREWASFLDEITDQNPNLSWYELPTLSDAMLLNRPNIDGGMRAAIREAKIRDRTITLYLDKTNFLTSLNIPTDQTIAILLVKKDGEIVWQTNSGFNKERFAALKTAIDLHSQ
jgi:hypothetical protein